MVLCRCILVRVQIIDPCPQPKAPRMHARATYGKWKKVIWSNEFTWACNGTRIHCGKLTNWSRDSDLLGSPIHVNINLTHATYLNFIADQVNPSC